MAAIDITGPPTVSELERLSRSFLSRSIHEQDLAQSLRHQGLAQAADNNGARARLHRRTAEILKTYAREMEAPTVSAPMMEAAE